MRGSEERNALKQILPAISVSYLANHYFNKSTSWFYQRLNGNPIHGKIYRFTPEEIETINGALKEIGERILSTEI